RHAPRQASVFRPCSACRSRREPALYISSGSPVSSHSRQTQSRSRAPMALNSAATIVTPQVGQIGGRSSSTPEVSGLAGMRQVPHLAGLDRSSWRVLVAHGSRRLGAAEADKLWKRLQGYLNESRSGLD